MPNLYLEDRNRAPWPDNRLNDLHRLKRMEDPEAPVVWLAPAWAVRPEVPVPREAPVVAPPVREAVVAWRLRLKWKPPWN